MKNVKIDLGKKTYEIKISSNIISNLGAELKPYLSRKNIWIISDENILNIYQARFEQSLNEFGINFNLMKLPSGEAVKSFSFFEKIVNWLLETGIERDDLIIAFGGGVIGDLVGFAASTTLRGVDFIQIPTTLLSQVDSSVGGKTGINSSFGKNLIGSFNQPKAVIIDIEVLNTLSNREFRSGYSEIVKYGLLADINFFNWLDVNGDKLLSRDQSAIKYAINRSCSIKAKIVIADEKEKGERALLNLGHTFGHALESLTGYSDKLLHGEGVSIGCMLAFEVSSASGFCSSNDLERVKNHFKKNNLKSKIKDINQSFPPTSVIMEEMFKDKKVKNELINFVMVRSIGEAFITNEVDLGVVSQVIEQSR